MASGVAGCAPEDPPPVAEPEAPDLPLGKDPDDFIVHSENPLALETKRDAFGAGVIVPASLLYVRNNLPLPDPAIVEDPDVWALTVEGVQKPARGDGGRAQDAGGGNDSHGAPMC